MNMTEFCLDAHNIQKCGVKKARIWHAYIKFKTFKNNCLYMCSKDRHHGKDEQQF